MLSTWGDKTGNEAIVLALREVERTSYFWYTTANCIYVASLLLVYQSTRGTIIPSVIISCSHAIKGKIHCVYTKSCDTWVGNTQYYCVWKHYSHKHNPYSSTTLLIRTHWQTYKHITTFMVLAAKPGIAKQLPMKIETYKYTC